MRNWFLVDNKAKGFRRLDLKFIKFPELFSTEDCHKMFLWSRIEISICFLSVYFGFKMKEEHADESFSDSIFVYNKIKDVPRQGPTVSKTCLGTTVKKNSEPSS